MKYSMIEFRVFGPGSKPYRDLAQELESDFKKNGTIIRTPILFSEPVLTSAFISIGTGVALHLINKLVDKLIAISKKQPSNDKLVIKIYIEEKDKTYNLLEEKMCLDREFLKKDE